MKEKNQNDILLISPDYPPPFIGGSLVYIHNLINNSSLNHDVLTNHNNRINEGKVSYIESKYIVNSQSPSRYQLSIMYLYIFLTAYKLKKYRVVVLNIGVIGNGLLAVTLKLFNVKTIIISYAEEITMSLYSSGLKGIIKKIFLGFYRKTNAVISVSNFAKNILLDDINLKSPIYVIPTPLHLLKHFKTSNSYSSQNNQILSVGRLIKRKGFSHLISAFDIVIKSIPSAKLIIVGDGPEYDSLNRKILSLKLSDSIKILRSIKDEQLIRFYKESELFVLANLLLDNGDCEGAPNVIVEAASFGLPTIAGKEGGTSDVVKDGISGLLINPLDHKLFSNNILALLNNDELREKMSRNSIEKVIKEHNHVKAGEAFRDVINNI